VCLLSVSTGRSWKMYFGACRIFSPVPMVETIPFQHRLGFKVVIYQVVYIFAIDGSKHEGWGAAHVVGSQVCVFVFSNALMARDPEECNFCRVLFAYPLCLPYGGVVILGVIYC